MAAPACTVALATPHTAATAAARSAFADGGTAVDAALAACATLAVVYPHMCSLGGDVIALVHAPDGRVTVVNGSGAAPAALDAARVRAALERDPAPVTRSGMPLRGPHTVTVPGVLAAWETLRGLGCRLDLARLLCPAIGYARDGCDVSRSLADTLTVESDVFAADPGLRDVFFSGGRPLSEGDTFRQPALAASLETVARHGVGSLYGGTLGAGYVAGLRALGSEMTVDDLARHATEIGEPLRHTAFGHELLTAPPNSQGYVLLQLLAGMALLPAVDSQDVRVARSPTPPDPLGPAAGALARLFRLASDDRDRHLCDPRAHDIPLDDLLGTDHVRSQVERSARDVAPRSSSADSAQADSGDPLPHNSDRPIPHGSHGATGDTIACVAADSEGWAASIIQSVYQGFGAAILEPSTGIVAHDRGACFSLDPASPNLVAGGKRPLHTLMPVMIRHRGRLTIVAGTMGGEAQPQIHGQILCRLLGRPGATTIPAGGLTTAVSAPRWTYDDGELFAEARVPASCLAALRATAMPVRLLEDVDETVGHAQYVLIGADGPVEAASDPRADGSAALYTRR